MPNPGLLAALLKTGRLTGVLRWKVELTAEQVAVEQAASGFTAFQLDTTGVKSLTEFFAVCSKQFNGAATDFSSFESLLKNLNNGASIFVIWSGWEDFAKENYDDALAIVNIFEEVAQTWPGTVLVVGKNGKFKDLAELAGV